MAKRIVDEEMRFTVIVNGNSAQKELFDLEKNTRSLTNANKDLRAEKARLAAAGQKDTEAYRNLTAEIKQNTTVITSNKERMKVLQTQIGVTGLTMSQLRKRASQLRLQLNNMVPGSAQYIKLENDLKQVNGQLTKLRISSNGAKGAVSRLGAGFNKFALLGATVIASITGMVLSIQKFIDLNSKLADSQSDVQKTTGLTGKEVDELTKKFGLFQTRTARIELLKLAEEAGRLGKEGVDDVLAFVKVANQIKVALGDDLGDEQIREVGKMVSIYKVGEKEGKNFEEAMLALGSSINEVSASGANQASFLVDFIKRTAGISDVANISAQDMIGLAAAFDEAGQSQEISATAINKAYGSMAKESEKFAKVAGVSVKEFSKLLEEDANEALILFLKGLKQGNPSLEEMSTRLSGIELGGTRGAQAISALASNIENLESKQRIANESLKEATSLTDEYNLKNNNLAALLEKIQNKLTNIFVSESIVEGLTNFVSWFAKFIGASEDADGSVTRFRNRLVALLKAIIIVGAALLSNVVYLKLSVLWTATAARTSRLYAVALKVQTIATEVAFAATQLYAAVMMLLTGNVKGAMQAIRVLSATMKTTPFGLIIGLVTALVTAYVLFSEASEQAATSQSLLNSAMAEADKNTAATIKQKQLLLDVARDETLSLKQRQEAIDELNRIVPEYNNNLSLEVVNTLEATAALDKHIESLKQSAIAYVLQERIKNKAIELSDLENGSLEDSISWYEQLWAVVKNGGDTIKASVEMSKMAMDNKYEAVDATKEEIKILEELYKTQLRNNPNQSGSGDTGPKEGDTKTVNGKTFIFENGQWKVKNPIAPTNDGSGGSGGKSKIDEAKKEAEELLKIQRETEDQRLSLIQEQFAREMAINDTNQRRKVSDLTDKAAETLEAYDKAIVAGNTDLAAPLLAQYNQILDQIELAEDLHQVKRNQILESGIENHIKSLEDKYIKEEQQREIAHNNELAALGNNEVAKEALQDQFNKDRLDRQKANEKLLIAELQKVLDTSNFEGFNLDLLTDAQLAKIKANLADLGLSLSEINKLLSAMQGGDDAAMGELAGIGIDGNGEVDILGMTGDQWSKIFERSETLAGVIGKVGQIALAGVQAFAMYDQFVTASENQKLQKLERNANTEIARQDRLLKNKLISKQQHDQAVEAEEDKIRKKRFEIEHEQAKRQKQMTIATIVGNQAIAISKAFAQGGGLFGPALAGVVIAFTAAQLLAAMSQPLPAKGFEKGFYGNTMQVRREQDGKVFNAGFGGDSRSGVVDKPTVFLAGEGGKNFPELIINGPDLKQFNPDLKNSLYRELGRIKGFESGVYKPTDTSPSGNNNDTELQIMTLQVLKETTQVLRDIKENGIEAYLPRNFTNAKRIREDIKRLETLENKSKIN